MKESQYKIGMMAVLLIQVCLFCIHPPYPDEIFLQHIATVIAIAFLVVTTVKNNMSNTGFLCLTLMVSIHIVGARWNYSNTPYDAWFQSVFGWSIDGYFDCQRNHYDRFVHFMYGMLMIIPVAEVYHRWIDIPKRLAIHAAFLFVLASSMMYELLEWMVAVWMSPAQAEAYNGQQGDLWDAQKDMALATLGAIIMIMIIKVVRNYTTSILISDSEQKE